MFELRLKNAIITRDLATLATLLPNATEKDLNSLEDSAENTRRLHSFPLGMSQHDLHFVHVSFSGCPPMFDFFSSFPPLSSHFFLHVQRLGVHSVAEGGGAAVHVLERVRGPRTGGGSSRYHGQTQRAKR